MNIDWNVTALFVGLLVFLVPAESTNHRKPVIIWVLKTCGHNPDLLGMNFHQQTRASHLQPILSLILYLCSDEPEVDDSRQPGEGVHKPGLIKTRNGFKLFPPDRPRIWTVGAETGVKLREFSRSSSAEGHTVRPHIRRPHWHGYWTGPKQGERRFSYRWIPAILVGKS